MSTAAAASPPERRLRGIGLRSLGTIAFGFQAALLKAASDHGVRATEMVFYRNAGALPLVALWIALAPGFAAVRTRRPLSHATRSAVGLASMLLTYGALALLPLAEATTLTYSAPILATLLSALLLGEQVGRRRWAAVAAGFAGLLLVVRPGTGALPALGLAVGVLAAVSQAFVMITLRTIGRTEGTAAIVWWFTVSGVVTGAVLLVPFGQRHAGEVYAMLLGAGLFGAVGQLGMTGALRFAPVSVVAPFDYLQIVVAMLLGWLAFGAAPVTTTLAGAGLIAASGIYTAYRERRRGKVPLEAEGLAE